MHCRPVSSAVEAYNFGDGRVVWENGVPRFQYRLADHLGNTVVFFEDKNNNGCITTEEEATSPADLEIVQRLLYYPFGMALEGLGAWSAQPWQQYRYNGKERDTLTGWYDYGARWGLLDIGRWNGVDPLAGKMPGWSPYSYGFDNPVMFVDPDGRAPSPPDDYRLKQDGTVEFLRTTTDAKDKLFAYHLDGTPTGEHLEVEKGVLQEYKKNEKNGTTQKNDPFSFVEINSNEDASKVFEFFSVNTLVEFSHIKFEENGNVITTTHNPSFEGGGQKMAYDKAVAGIKITEKIHSHPTDGDPSPPDMRNVAYWKTNFPDQKIMHKIYKVISQQYIKFDENGEIK